VRVTEVFKILSTRSDHRVVRRKRRRRDLYRPPIGRLGIVRPPGSLGDDGEVVERVGQIRVERTEFGLLKLCGVSEQLFS
jgi:hypothetical protein